MPRTVDQLTSSSTPTQPETAVRALNNKLNAVLQGQGNNYFEATLVPDETSTELSVEFASSESIANFHARSATAAASIASVWSECANGRVILHHDAAPDEDRVFGVQVNG